jgi:hypothetical protein
LLNRSLVLNLRLGILLHGGLVLDLRLSVLDLRLGKLLHGGLVLGSELGLLKNLLRLILHLLLGSRRRDEEDLRLFGGSGRLFTSGGLFTSGCGSFFRRRDHCIKFFIIIWIFGY